MYTAPHAALFIVPHQTVYSTNISTNALPRIYKHVHIEGFLEELQCSLAAYVTCAVVQMHGGVVSLPVTGKWLWGFFENA